MLNIRLGRIAGYVPARAMHRRGNDRAFLVESFMAKPRGIVEDIIRLGEEGQPPKQIAIMLDCALSNVYRVLDKYDVDYERKKFTEKEKEEIVSLRKNRWTYKKIANKYGRSRQCIKDICVKSGVIVDLGNQYTNGSFDRIENAKRYIRERTPDFEYAGNFTGIDGYVDLKCKTCGEVTTKSFVSVKHGKAVCEICRRREIEANRRQREKEAAEAKEAKRKIREARELEKQKEKEQREKAKEHPCPVCGNITRRPVYCSDHCCNRVTNTRHEARRRALIMAQLVDADISLEKLYERDKGMCHICGLKCSWEDYEIVDGQKQCKSYYPSIDHVVPLSKGGEHSWDNVKLAHRMCNSFKGDKSA